ncbi:MAG: cytochrome ubiquinol oxidase subunit I [Actinomycetes bacterium]
MAALDLARWQFAVVTIYHFFFVPITIGMAFVVAALETVWVRTDNPVYLRATRFWGKLFLINFAIGVVTGIVQEFQFGMNWSAYSRYVGDIFGAPLAIEGLLAFFMESTFLGLWIFGWDKLPKKLHAATMWMTALGTMLSAYFILAANSWMQHPVGYRLSPTSGRAELTNIVAVLTQDTVVSSFTHVMTACFVVAGAFMVAISGWQLVRKNQAEVFRPSLRIGLVVLLLAAAAVTYTGDEQARIMTQQQPMKMAAAEALYQSAAPASFSIFTIGTLNGSAPIVQVRIPHVLSLLATRTLDGKVAGINNVQAAEVAKYGPGNYKPNIPLLYWSFRIMVGIAGVAMLIALLGLWLTRKGRLPRGRWARWFYFATPWTIALGLAGTSIGWIFTEEGRQPWVVYGLLRTADAVSPSVSWGEVLTSFAVFTLLYGVLAFIEVRLMLRAMSDGAPEIPVRTRGPAGSGPGDGAAGEAEAPMEFAY